MINAVMLRNPNFVPLLLSHQISHSARSRRRTDFSISPPRAPLPMVLPIRCSMKYSPYEQRPEDAPYDRRSEDAPYEQRSEDAPYEQRSEDAPYKVVPTFYFKLRDIYKYRKRLVIEPVNYGKKRTKKYVYCPEDPNDVITVDVAELSNNGYRLTYFRWREMKNKKCPFFWVIYNIICFNLFTVLVFEMLFLRFPAIQSFPPFNIIAMYTMLYRKHVLTFFGVLRFRFGFLAK